ncbi:TYRO protein tyrosine kinase-binding protein [Python bivittatus]|uniref:TYRO protein tyrosine kinase-binding protein n=1 Tax=Python bivittatus TaxID=176946 RepID=A0A9F2R8N8_PYTBI|nr:TYRO protein tyrosine kinase-binding protein [Python bivittatus]
MSPPPRKPQRPQSWKLESGDSQPERLQGQRIPSLGTSNMAQLGFPVLPILLGLTWPQLGAAQVANDCGHCYQINPGTIAGVVLGDLLLTLLIALGVYYVVSCVYKRQATSNDKTQHESPYEELQGRRMDIYSDLKNPGPRIPYR